MGPLLACVVASCIAGDVFAQTTAEDAERIARLRDQSASEPAKDKLKETESAEAAPAGDGAELQASVDADAEVDKYAGNGGLPLGPSGSSGLNLTTGGSGTGKLGDGWLMSTLAALGVVLALVFGIRWLLRRGGVVTSSAPQGSIVEVLSRTTVAPRSHVVLMRIGQRILVVNDSTNGMRTLASIEDPEEVADLLGAIEADRPTSMTKSFSGMMSRLSSNWSDSDAELDDVSREDALEDGVGFDQTRGAVSSVRGRLAALSGGGMKA